MISISVDTGGALVWLTKVQEKQVPYAMMLTMNRVANDAQQAEQERLQKVFNLKRLAWNLHGIKINKVDRATKTFWSVVIQVDAQRSYLEKFEEGGEKVPIGGRRMLAIPGKALSGKILSPDNPLKPKNLDLKQIGKTWRGKEHTFIMQLKNGKQAIMQRMVSGHPGFTVRSVQRAASHHDNKELRVRKRRYGEAGYRLLYTLQSRVKVKAKLEFVETISRAAQAAFLPRWNEAFAEAMRTAI